MEKLFIAYLTSGLGNRLRPLAAALAYCELTGRTLKVYWDNVTPNGCLTPLEQLFKNEFEPISLDEIEALEGTVELYTEKGKGHGVEREAARFGRDQLLKLAQKFPPRNATDVPLESDADVIIVYDNNYIPAIPKEASIKHLRGLEPVDEVVQQVMAIATDAHFFRGIKGVHARGTDFGLNQALEMYTGMIRSAIGESEPFFLSTDDAELEHGLCELFAERIITRPERLHLSLNEGKESWFDPDSFTISEQHGIDALVDLYLLSCTNLVVYHPGSTFSEISQHLHDVLSDKYPDFLPRHALTLNDLKDEFKQRVIAILPRNHQGSELDFSAGLAGPAFLETANPSFLYLETLGFNTPILERMFFSGSAHPTLEWDADLVSMLAAIPYEQFPFELFDRLCPYPEAIPQLKTLRGYILNRKVLIIGSEYPWLEIFCAISGAKQVTTVEYRPITWKGALNTPTELKILTWNDFESGIESHLHGYDIVISYSSIEHSGLGRYGDQLTPLGDLYTFMLISKCMAPHGMCNIAVPVGQDLTHFNAHRIYGPKRIRALEMVANLKFIGISPPDRDYYQAKEQDPNLREQGWSLASLFELPLGSYRQPILCFANEGFSQATYVNNNA